MTIDISQPFYSELIANHREWLANFDKHYSKKWEDLLKNDPESAVGEAAVRRFLSANKLHVIPNEDLDGDTRTPDYRCETELSHFYVEVSRISIQNAIDITGLSDSPNGEFVRNPSSLSRKVFQICRNKATQCANSDAPVLLAITTAHSKAAMHSFGPPYTDMILCGKTTMTVSINLETLKSDGSVRLDSQVYESAFFTPDEEDEVVAARRTISGLLLCGITLGRQPDEMWVTGLLNPNAVRPFEIEMLPTVRFRSAEYDPYTGQLHLYWCGGV